MKIGIVERLKFDAVRCEATFSKGVASNIEEAVAEIDRLTAENEKWQQEAIAWRRSASAAGAENERLLAAIRSTASQGTLNMLAIRKAVSFELAELIWDEHMACQQATP